jgi:RND superfamily putative drug exporter
VGEALVNNFPRNETLPIQVLVRTQDEALGASSLDALFGYTRQLQALPGVTRVDSLVTLDPRLDAGGSAAYAAFYASIGNPANPQAIPAARAAGRFAHGDYSVVNVLYSGEPLGSAAQDLVRQIRDVEPPAGLSALVGGYTAELDDFMASLQMGVPWAFGLIVVVMFVLLFLMLGSVIVPLKAVLLNILSLSASFGALVWIFQDGNLAGLLNFTPLGNIDGTMPVLIFAIAFGLSMDYEVFLLSRIKETHDHTGDTVQAVATGVQRTGGIITSAALLLVVVIAGFALGDVLFVKQVGVGLALAIIVDATLVRTLLVPATMRLLGRYNWWAPRPLAALYSRLGFGERDLDEVVAPAPPRPQAARSSRPGKSDNAQAGV